MKKLFAFMTALALICTMSISAFAADGVTVDGNTSAELKVKYSESSKTDAYAAKITWGSMTFTYTSAAQKWNTTDLKWENENGAKAGWSTENEDGAGTVTVENRSSQAITAKFSFEPQTETHGVTGIKINNADIVADGYSISAATAGATKGEEAKFSILPTGDYTGTSTEAFKVGTITITLE